MTKKHIENIIHFKSNDIRKVNGLLIKMYNRKVSARPGRTIKAHRATDINSFRFKVELDENKINSIWSKTKKLNNEEV